MADIPETDSRPSMAESPEVLDDGTVATDKAREAWKVLSPSEWVARHEAAFGPEASPAPVVGIVGDGVTAGTAADELVARGYRVIAFGKSVGGQAFSMIDEIAHHKTRIGGASIAVKGLARPEVLFVPADVDLARIPDLVETFHLSGVVVAVGGQERRNEKVDYSVPGVLTLRKFIERYHKPLDAGQPVTNVDFGLPVPPSEYPGMAVAVQGAGRGVEDFGVKIRYLQSMLALASTGYPVGTISREDLFKGPREVPGHLRMAHNFIRLGFSPVTLGEAFVVHRGSIPEFKWQDPKKRHMEEAILRVQQDTMANGRMRELFDANPAKSPDEVVELYVRRFDEAFRSTIESEVREWMKGYSMEVVERTQVVGTGRTGDKRVRLHLKQGNTEYTRDVDLFVTSLGSTGIHLGYDEVTRGDGIPVPVELAGMSFDGRGAVGPSTQHAKKASAQLAGRMEKSGSAHASSPEVFQSSVDAAHAAQDQAGYAGDMVRLLVGDPGNRGAFPEFYRR